MQYLLPWGLYGMHELIQYEAKRRRIMVADGVSSLSVLAAEGVPNFDALSLVLGLGVERVDATRLSDRYPRRTAVSDIGAWLSGMSWAEVERIVRGADNRRVDPFLRTLQAGLRAETVASAT